MFLVPISKNSRVKGAVFQAWRLAVVLAQLAGARSEVGHLRVAAGRRSNSIWLVNRDELVKVARCELGISYKEDLQAECVKKEDLQAECLNCDIIADATWMRPRMIVAIREDVKERVRATSQLTAEVTQTTEDHGQMQRSSSSRRRSHAETAQDWEDLSQQPRRSSSRVRIQDILQSNRH